VADYDEQDPENDTPVIRQLREKLEEQGKQLKADAGARRELAFIKAGVDTSSKQGQYFLKAYEGDLSDIEALKTEAGELGLLGAGAPTVAPETQPPASEPTGSVVRTEVAGPGAEAPGGEDNVPVEQRAKEAFDAAMNQGATFEDAAATWFNVKAASKLKELGVAPHPS